MAEPGINTPSTRPQLRRFRAIALGIAAFIAVAYVVWCAALYVYQDEMIFPRRFARRPLAAPVPAAIVSKLDIPDGKVESWLLRPPIGRIFRRPVIVFLHGNAEVIDYQREIVEGYQALGCAVLLPEYRGYGRSAGQPSEEGITSDLVRFYDELVRRTDVDTSRIVIHGRSLGGGFAAQLAARRKPRALILQCTFTSLAAMAHRYAAPAWLVRHPMRTDEILPALSCPILIFHGTQDSLIPVRHGRRLHELAPGSLYVEMDSDHNDFPGAGNREAYWSAIRRFLAGAGVLR